jgi:hypothetical protein
MPRIAPLAAFERGQSFIDDNGIMTAAQQDRM